jgi:hypothetical protein
VSFRPLIHIPRGAAGIALFVTLLLVGGFFIATRTEVGRDVLKSEIERRFNSQVDGTLRIGTLTGNLVYRFIARDIELLDDEGTIVVRIDSLVASPRWRRLAQGRVELGRLHVFGMHASLVRDIQGKWNLQKAFAARLSPDSSGGKLKSVAIGDLRISGSSVSTSSTAPPSRIVESGVLFDYENSRLAIRNLHSILDWRPSDAQIDVIHFSASVENRNFDLSEMAGQIVFNDNTILANQFSLNTPRSSVQFSGALDNLQGERANDARIDISLTADPIDHTEFSRILPESPFRSSTAVVARVQGPISALVIEELSMTRRASHLALNGTLIGLPDSLDFEISVTRGTLRRKELREILFDTRPLARTYVDSVDISLLARGVIHDPFESASISGDVFLDIGGDAGRVSGRVTARHPTGEAWSISSNLFAGDLQLDRVVPGLRGSTSINGDVSMSMRGFDPQEMELTAEFSLGQSSIMSRTVDSLRAVMVLDEGRLRSELQASRGDGRAEARVEADISGEPFHYAINASVDRMDFGPLLAVDSLRSSITARGEAKISMSDVNDIVGDFAISVDSSLVEFLGRSRLVDPGTLAMELTRPETNISSLRISGDVLSGELNARGELSTVMDLTRHWIQEIRAARSETLPATVAIVSASADSIEGDPEVAQPVVLNGSLSVLNSGTLGAFLPAWPQVSAALRADFSANLARSRASVRLGLDGDSLQIGRVRLDQYSGSFSASTNQGSRLIENLAVAGSFFSERFSMGGGGIRDIDVELEYRDTAGDITIAARQGERIGPLDISAGLALLSDQLAITPRRFNMRAGGYDWELTDASPIRITRNSVRTSLLTFQNPSTGSIPGQRVLLRGGISNSLSDRLLITTDDVDLAQVSNILSMKRSLAGRLGGEFTLSRQDGTPVVEARASMIGLGLDERILGDLVMSSSLTPGTAEGILDLTLSPTSLDSTAGTRVRNQAKVAGTFRLPSFDTNGNRTDPGYLDLTAVLDRADLFFFEYIFPGTVQNVTGYTAGSIHIGGDLSRPVFDANLRIADGHFHVPRFNLAMALTADVEVDRYGIHVRRADILGKTNGSVQLKGDILFNDYKFFSFNLEGQLDEFQIMDVASSRELPFYGHIWASGTATLSGPLSKTVLRATNASATSSSELYIPIVESGESSDAGFIVFADSTGEIPDLVTLTRRRNLLSGRPTGERGFTEGMDMELNIDAPPGSTVHLVIDPLLGDVINGVGSGRIQILRQEGEFQTFGSFQVNSGDYLFTAGEVFVRRFLIEEGGEIIWDGDPANARLDIPAAFRTRASRAGLQAGSEGSASLIPVVVNLQITGRVAAPEVALSLSIDRSSQTIGSTSDQEFLETILNNPQLSTEYATSVLLTNSFALTTASASGGEALGTGAFNSLSQLIAAQLNRYLSTALPNVDFSFGVQGQTSQELDITYGVALRLLDERLVIRGQGVYQGAEASTAESLQGEFVVEVRVSNNVSLEVFYRREGDLLVRTLTSTAGAGISYRTEFPTWKRFFQRMFGWMRPRRNKDADRPDIVTARMLYRQAMTPVVAIPRLEEMIVDGQ